MKSIAIIGAGQSGLLLSLSLLQRDFQVTLVADRTPEEIRKGRVMSSQVLFDQSLQIERKAGLDHWEAACPKITGISFTLVQEGKTLLDWSSGLDAFAQSVDQRMKLANWAEQFARGGGKLLVQPCAVALAEQLAETHDLVIIAAGKGELSHLLERDAARSCFHTPQRILALAYLKVAPPFRDTVGFNTCPGIGECFLMPSLTHSGPCEIVFFEGIPGGPLDCWSEVKTPEAHLQKTIALLEPFFPERARRYKHAELTDDQATLVGKYTPEVRKPVAFLPSGKPVLGMGDAVVLNDPITGQGANSATKCAAVYLERIIKHRGELDVTWMQETFERYWAYAKWVTAWTNAMLLPPPPHVQHLLGAAAQVPGVAQAIVNGFNHPPDLFPWMAVPEEAEKFIASGGRKQRVRQVALC